MINVIMPALSPTMETGNLVAWLKREGDVVAPGDALAEIETDKASVSIEAAGGGILSKILVPEGARDVPVNEIIALIADTDESAAPAPAEPAPVAPTAVAPSPEWPAAVTPVTNAVASATGARVFASPIARRLAREAGIDVATLSGSGPNGRIVERDIGAPARGAFAAGAVAQLSLSVDCDAGAMQLLRANVNAAPSVNDADGPHTVSVTDIVLKAWALALARILPSPETVVGLAVAVAGGVAVPVIRSAHTKSLFPLGKETRDLAARARAQQLAPAESTGAGSTVANLGMHGISRVAATVRPGESALLAVGAIQARVVVRDGQPAVATMMSATLAVDLSAVDAVTAARLLNEFKRCIESPVAMLLAGP